MSKTDATLYDYRSYFVALRKAAKEGEGFFHGRIFEGDLPITGELIVLGSEDYTVVDGPLPV